MTIIQTIVAWMDSNGWATVGGLLTAGYIAILGIMIRKVLRDRALPEEQRPGPRPLFYLGQAYLAFVWPVPLFLVLEALELLSAG